MPEGQGKYDKICTYARETAEADAVGVLIIGGVQGDGFSVQGDALFLRSLPNLLRHMADQIEEDVQRGLDG
jgi:hypothetical protein